MYRLLRMLFMGGVTLLYLVCGSNEARSSGIMTLPEGVLLTSEASGNVEVSCKWLQRLFREEVLEASGWEPDMVEISKMDPSTDVLVQEAPVSYRVDPPSRISPGQRVGIRVNLFGENGRMIRRIWVSGRVGLYQFAWVLNGPIGTSEVLRRSDISQQRIQVREIPPGALDDAELFIGMQATRSLAAGTVLRRDHLEAVPLVQKGQRVQIVLETAFLRLVAPGECLEGGGSGELVRVLNLSSRQVVNGCVRDPQTVQVAF